MDIRKRLTELAHNLYWTWHPETIHIFRDLNQELWRAVNHNPVELLARLSDEELKEKTGQMALESRITHAFHSLRDYMELDNTWSSRYAGGLEVNPVAYFSAEFGVHESLPIYSGGLGVLAGDHLKAASDLGIRLIGVGLLYAKGYFRQSLDGNGRQQESYFAADIGSLPVEPVTDSNRNRLRILLRTSDPVDIWVQAWSVRVGRCRLILLDTNVPENTEEIRSLTAQLYGGDRQLRIRQELVLGVGGMRMLEAMGIRPGVVHINEGHSAFVLLELARTLMERDGQSFPNVQEMVAAMGVFTMHTPVAAGHDRFDPALLERTLGPLREQLGISRQELLALGRVNTDDPNEQFCMTVLGMKLANARNAVSFLHCRVSRAMWRDAWPNKPIEQVPIAYVTNGIHVRTWLATEMDHLYTRCMGEAWQERMYDPHVWEPVEGIDDEELWEMNQILLAHMIDFVRRRVGRQHQARGEPDPTKREDRPFLSPSVLTIGFARRFAPYKRSNILFHDLNRLDRLINDPHRPVQIVFAGKAHPADEEGKGLIQTIFRITHDARFVGRIVFVEDYDINVARHLVQGVNLWLNTPRRPLEACGTSGMKAVLNGALHLSVLDGWWAEAYDGRNGFAIGHGGEHSDWAHQDRTDVNSLFEVLENEVVPMFYRRGADGVPRDWVRRQKHALRTLPWRFSAQRMVTEYTRHCYLPAVGGTTSSFASTLQRWI